MGRGMLSGVIWGGAFGGLVVTVLSLYAPLPAEKAAMRVPVEAPADTSEAATDETSEQTQAPEQADTTEQADTEQTETEQADTAPTDTEAETDTIETAVAETTPTQSEEDATAPQAQVDAPQANPVVADGGTAQTAAPQSDPAVTTAQAPTLEQDTAEAAVTSQDAPSAPQVANVDGTAPAAPAAEEATPAVTDLAGSPSNEDTAPSGLVLPQADSSPEADATPAPRIAATPEAAPQTSPEATTVSADTPIILPVPKIDNPVAGVVTNRLPSVTAPDTAQDPATSTDEAANAPATGEEVQEAALDAEEVGALRAYAATYEGEPTASQFAVILIDTGAEGMPRSELIELGVPFSVAIDPVSADAAEAAAAYRAAGIEVLAMPSDLPASAGPSDVAVALSGYFSVLNEAIAVMDPLDGRIQSNRSLLQPVLGAIRDTGHGLVTYDRGLNTAQQAARREGIAAATVFRLLDAELEEAPKIKRYLSRAAFNAGKDGSVVVVGRSYPETVKALLEWALDEKGADLSIVPVSQVMLQDLN
ncbi:polysaccharide deacteylase family 2 protein [uncultured Litoreibacter sp.]|uniref:divergent polysaccharide deacetylase family protein n=1 Tax=uncultured Litoreibacter sp. TaxID=1392394 RepID=UPI00262FE82F|nr:polysaccharide deacteylase family 2 protein [uncultured Litoreibacter sp.]